MGSGRKQTSDRCGVGYSASRKSAQSIFRFKPPESLHIMRLELGERGGLERDMRMAIGLRRMDRLLPEPKRDHRQVDTCPEQFHRGGVPKDVRRYPLVLQ